MADVFKATIESNIPDVLAADSVALLASARRVIRQRIGYLKTGIGREIRRAGLGERLAKALHSEVRETADGIEGTITGRATVKRQSGSYDLIALFRHEQVISVGGKHFLAIPLPAAGHGPRGRKARVSDFAEGLVPRIVGDAGVLVRPEDPETPLFVLTRRVHIAERLDLSRVIGTATKDLGNRIVRDWARHRARIALRLVA
jgi:hypothetical protein